MGFAFCLTIVSIVLLFLVEYVPSVSNHCQTLNGCSILYNETNEFRDAQLVKELCQKWNGSHCLGSTRCCYMCSKEKHDSGMESVLFITFYDDIESTFHIALTLYIISWACCLSIVFFDMYIILVNNPDKIDTLVKDEDFQQIYSSDNSIFNHYGNTVVTKVISTIGFILYTIAIIIITIMFVKYLRSFDCTGYVLLSMGWGISFVLYLYFVMDSYFLDHENPNEHVLTSCLTSCVLIIIKKFVCCGVILIVVVIAIYVLYKKFVS
jgi:hypothetical protein